MSFGNRLRKLREDKNITQQKLGEIVGVSARVIGYYESNDRFPKDEKILINIAKYFNVSIDYLLGITNNQILRIPLIFQENNEQLKELFEVIKKSSKDDIDQLIKYAKFIISQRDEK